MLLAALLAVAPEVDPKLPSSHLERLIALPRLYTIRYVQHVLRVTTVLVEITMTAREPVVRATSSETHLEAARKTLPVTLPPATSSTSSPAQTISGHRLAMSRVASQMQANTDQAAQHKPLVIPVISRLPRM
jgi:hypothetical protein